MRTALNQTWVDAHAFATLHYAGFGLEARKEELSAIAMSLYRGAELVGGDHLCALGDYADAMARIIRDLFTASPVHLSFINLDTGEAEEAALFESTPDGERSVWAIRLTSAALAGDVDMCRALVDARVASGDQMGLGLSLRALALGAGQLLHQGYHQLAQQLAANEATTGIAPKYTLLCRSGGPVGPPSTRDCIRRHYPDFHVRNERAALHTLSTGHAVQVGEE